MGMLKRGVTRSMRILVLSHEYPPVGGGAGASCALLSEQYAELGHDVTVLTMSFDALPVEETVNGVRVLRQACGRKRWEMASPIEGLWWAREAWSVAIALHRQQPFDVTHAHFIMPAGIVARWLQRQTGVPHVITPRGSDVPGYNRERLKLAHLLARPWWRLIVRQAKQIISPSRSLLELIQAQETGVQATVIPNGVNVLRFLPSEKQHRILLCSRLVERKGFQYFFKGIGATEPGDWRVDLVGSGPYESHLKELAEQCRWPVTWHGRIDNRDPRLAELYGRASIFVLPSERENCPVAILEAMTAGCAVVTTNVTGNPEVLGDTGRLVPPCNAPALGEVIRDLTHDDAQCRMLGHAARQRVLMHFEPRQIATRNLAILESILGRQEVSQ